LKKTENIRLLQQAIACLDDAQAYKQLFIIFQPSLIVFANSIIKSKEISEEIVSDVFLKIWEKRHSLDKVENLKFYLFTAVKNRAINKLQDVKRNTSISIDETSVEFTSLYHDPEQKMISAEMVAQIQAIIRNLPPRCQLIFKLVKEDGLKYKEVAELLQLSIKTVENQMTIALRKIGEAVGSSFQHFAKFFSEN
jgi:RNA polymerase sigma-70 factor (family 1)